MIEQLERLLQTRVDQYIGNGKTEFPEVERKRALISKRKGDLRKVKAEGRIKRQVTEGKYTDVFYVCRFTYLMKQAGKFFIEEKVENRLAKFFNGSLLKDEEVGQQPDESGVITGNGIDSSGEAVRSPYRYDRRKAVQYAERWWNDYNPQYKKFENNCTNFISQCLRAGGAPMRGYPNRTKGWWYQGGSWSYSWSVAHALCMYLSTAKTGLRAKEIKDPRNLQLGDVICYDFQGDGRFDHSTIVTGKDGYGFPLVNAQTTNSRLRYWSYEDSTAYTDQITYRFFSILDDENSSHP